MTVVHGHGMHQSPAVIERTAVRGSIFATTHWSVVLAAKARESPEGAEALADLCQKYWYPIYAFVRRRGYSPEDAQDLTQGFFAQLLEKEFLRLVDPQKGPFRAFLMMALDRFLTKERWRGQRLKRGGGCVILSLDEEHGEARYRLEPVDGMTPDRLFARRWALIVLERAMDRLAAECRDAGKEWLFARVRSAIAGDGPEDSYAALAGELGLSVGALKVAVHRLRRRHAELLREEVAQTVADPAAVDEEIRYLLRALG